MAKKAKRSRVDREQFWRDLIERQQHSGQSIREFCDWEGVSQPSFYSWRRRLQSANGKPRSPFVPVQVQTEGPAAAPGQIEIVLEDGRCIRVGPGVDRQTLEDVLAVLEQQRC